MLFKLSLKNIKKSIKDYSIYFFTLVIAVAIFYIFNSIDAQTSFLKLNENKANYVRALMEIIKYVSVFVSIILGFLIIYSNNFLIKRRKKEIGLYLTLGMSKQKVSIILVMETLFVGIISLGIGLLSGIFLSQLLSIVAANLFEVNMDSFHFIFSSPALFKTIAYFGIIFILMMFFNVIVLSRYKLIDLLNASKRNEVVKVRNKYLVIVAFILSIVLYAIAYHYLFNDAMFTMNNKSLWMIITGALATLLLFFSISGFTLWLFKKNKKVYYKKLNMFILKQLNNRMNTTIISTTIITLMLLLTIGILSGSISLSNAINISFRTNNITDFSLNGNYSIYNGDDTFDNKYVDFNSLTSRSDFNQYVKDYVAYDLYDDKNINYLSIMTKSDINKLHTEYGNVSADISVPLMKESDYIKIMTLYGMKDKIIDIDDNEYLELCNIDQIIEYYSKFVKEGNSITVKNTILTPAINEIQNIALENGANGNAGVIVVRDELVNGDSIYSHKLIGNYNVKDVQEKDDEAFKQYIDTNVSEVGRGSLTTKYEVRDSNVGVKVLMTYLGLYLGIIFAISSVTVLAIKELSESSDNKERYHVLRLIGTDEKMINKTLLTQIAISFLIPLFVALFHAFFGLREVNNLIKIIGNLDLTSSILLTSLFIVIVYGGYFLATYICSKNVIKE